MPGSLYDEEAEELRNNPPKIHPFASPNDLDQLEQRVSQVLEAMHNNTQGRLADQDQKIEDLEQQLAILAMAYAESAVMIEALVGQLHFATDEERELFHKTMKESRKHMVEVMTNVHVDGEDSGTEPAVEGVVSEDETPPTS